MKAFHKLILPFLVMLSRAPAIYAFEDKWYSLGNYIEEEGTDDKAGTAVSNSRDGTTIAVASPHYIPKGSDGKNLPGFGYGRVVVYRYDENTSEWNKIGDELVGEKEEFLGTSMKLSSDGNTLVAGTKADKDGMLEVGSVKVFTYSNGQWREKGEPIYGDNSFDYFGASVDIADGASVLAIGVPGHDEGVNNDAGEVRVYKYDISLQNWIQVQNEMKGDAPNERFGTSVSLSKVGKLAIGAPLAANSAGYVQVYQYENDMNQTSDSHFQFVELGQRLKGGGEGDRFGTSVSISYDGTKVAVGAPFENPNGLRKLAGTVRAYVFNFDDDAAEKKWQRLGDMMIGGNVGDQFGSSVSLSDDGEEVAVGSPYADAGNGQYKKREAGQITVYHYNRSGRKAKDWDKMHVEIDGKKAYSNMGFSVDISGDGYQVIGGAPTEGYASVYTLEKTAPPTPAPTPDPENSKSTDDDNGGGRRSGFATFVLVVFIISLLTAAMWFVFKFVQYYRKRRNAASFERHHYTNNNAIELRQVEVVDEGEGVI